MIVCGAKLTHDGGVALINDGRLIFSIEAEKINNSPRHSKFDDLSQIFDILGEHGYSVRDVDRFVFDGWRKTHKVKPFYGQDVVITLAPYRGGVLSSDPLREYRSILWDLPYSSYYHYSGHLMGSYCASPFAHANEPSWVLVWDGAMFPTLYYVDPRSVVVEQVSTLCPLLGNAYHEMALKVPPFNTGLAFPATLSIPGKMMALIARGSIDDRLLTRCREALAATEENRLDPKRCADELYFQEPLGQEILVHLLKEISISEFGAIDVLATWHEFLWQTLSERLRDAIEKDGRSCSNLIFSGGCALNIKWNRKLRSSGLFGAVWVPPFPNDSGSALGAAVCGWVKAAGLKPLEWSVYSGPELLNEGVASGWSQVTCELSELAELIKDQGEPIVVLNGRAEIGPRALGNRSIIAPATSAGTKSHINFIKKREDYRPVAPICLESRAAELFRTETPDPYMAFECDVRRDWVDRIPAVVHEDGTARVQTVNAAQYPGMHRLLERLDEITGVPLLCNTSANYSGCGFFASAFSAMEWGRTNYVWANNKLFSRNSRICIDHSRGTGR